MENKYRIFVVKMLHFSMEVTTDTVGVTQFK